MRKFLPRSVEVSFHHSSHTHCTKSVSLAMLFGKSRGADVLSRCDRKHGCALEIISVTQVFAFGCASGHMHQKKRTVAWSVVQRSCWRQKDRRLCPTDQPSNRKCFEVGDICDSRVSVQQGRCHWGSMTVTGTRGCRQTQPAVLNLVFWFVCYNVRLR